MKRWLHRRRCLIENLKSIICRRKNIFKNLNKIKLFIQSNKIKSWNDYQHGHYKSVNANNKYPEYPTDMRRHKIQVFSRLCLGYTFATHQHIFKEEQRSRCHFCGESLFIKHMLEDCNQYQGVRQSVFAGKSPLQLLEDPTRDNIESIYKNITLNKIII